MGAVAFVEEENAPAKARRSSAEHDPDIADLFNIELWTEIAGTRIGPGNYRPQRGGLFGRFEAEVTKSS